jgi:hypothetical protein
MMTGRIHRVLPFLILLAGALFWGCEKIDDDQKTTTPDFLVGVPQPDIAIQVYEPPLTISASCNSTEKIELDIDRDGLDDIEISVSWGCFHWGEGSWSEIRSLNRHLEVSVIEWIDTTYTCIETMDEWTYIHCSNDPEYYDCPVQEMVELTHSIYPGLYKKGEKLQEDRNWVEGEFKLASHSQHDDASLMVNPTLSSSFCRGFWDMGEDNYVAYRIRNGTLYKRGWLKIAACSTTIRLYEVACEKF